MNWTSLFGGSQAFQQLVQYPDVKLYNAAAKLRPEDRPIHPVRLIDPDPNKYPVFRRKTNIEGMVDMSNKRININRLGDGYKTGNIERLAGTLAHEAEHMRRLSVDNMDFAEGPAYERQYNALRKIGAKDEAYLEGIRRRIK